MTHISETGFGLLRHAPTVWNMEKRVQGHKDSPLTSRGKSLALAWGRMPEMQKWDRILVSDLGRALQTAELINTSLGLPISDDARLREKNWGEWTAKTIPQIRENSPELLAEMEKSGWAFRPPGGENRNEVWERSRQALADASRKWPGKRILVITHEGVIKCLIYRLSARCFLAGEPGLLLPCHLHELSCNSGNLFLRKINSVNLNPENT